jgi:hypothetical protein
MINRRMKRLSDEDFIKRIPYKPMDGSLGKACYVYTLGSNGVKYVKELLDNDVSWNKNIPYRKGAFINHHLYLSYLTQRFEEAFNQYDINYNGEPFAKYSVPKNDERMLDVFKPDLVWSIRSKGLGFGSFFVEHEKTEGRSFKKIRDKLSGHSEYATKGYYKEHDVLLAHDTYFPPSLVFISDSEKINNAYRKLISEYNWFDTNVLSGSSYYFSDILFTTTDEFMENPNGNIFTRLGGNKVGLEQSYYSSYLGHALIDDFKGKNTIFYPSFMCFRSETSKNDDKKVYFKADGIFQFLIGSNKLSFIIHYIDDASISNVERITRSYQAFDLNNHPILKGSIYNDKTNNPKVILLTKDSSNIETLASIVKKGEWGDIVSQILIVCPSDLKNGPKNAMYYNPFTNSRQSLL